MRSSLRRILAGTAAVVVLGAGPAMAAPGDTATTFTLADGGLGISVPANASLSNSTLIGTTSFSGQLGAITVTDHRGALLGSWTASVSSTSFTTGGGGANRTIAAGNVSYASGAATATTGVGVDVPTLVPVSLDESRTAFAHTGVIGAQSTTWNPTLTVTVPADVVAGSYSGTVTHSVA